MQRYEQAKEMFARYGADTEQAIRTLAQIPVSVHCWQGDDVVGFDGGGAASGGIQTTGNYPGRARTPEELMADIRFAFSLMPGKKRLNLHASYAILGDDAGKVDRDAYLPAHFAPWVKFAKEIGLDGIDFNPTYFSHSLVKNGLTLSSPDENVRKFWVRHGQACLKIAEYFAEEMHSHCLVNIWIPDGMKDVPADRLGPRLRLKQSLDEILSVERAEMYFPLGGIVMQIRAPFFQEIFERDIRRLLAHVGAQKAAHKPVLPAGGLVHKVPVGYRLDIPVAEPELVEIFDEKRLVRLADFALAKARKSDFR